MQKTRRDRTLEGVRELLIAVLLVWSCSSCANFAVGGAWNPGGLSSSSSFSMKAGSTYHARVSGGSGGAQSLLMGSLGSRYAREASAVSLQGSETVWVDLNSSRLQGANLPSGWSLNVDGDELALHGRSSTTYAGDELITRTRVSAGEHRVNISLSSPSDAKRGTYRVSASMSTVGGVVPLSWTVTIQ
jgi:hypothetical protein